MREAEFRAYLADRDLSPKTVDQRLYALARIERAEDLNLDDAFALDGMAGLMQRYTYSAQDARDGVANPSRMDIDADKLRTHLAWYKSHLNAYRLWRLGQNGSNSEVQLSTLTPVADPEIEGMVAEFGQTFGLERDLQNALRANLNQLEAGLRVIDGGSEKKVVSGFIDILAEDGLGIPTVIELKAGTARESVIAQILGYMADIAEERSCSVRGIIIAADFTPRVERAVLAVPNLKLKRYSYKFDFA